MLETRAKLIGTDLRQHQARVGGDEDGGRRRCEWTGEHPEDPYESTLVGGHC